MRYAIISDIHANLEAAEACLRKIDELKADRIICLGDLVDYGAEPNEVCDLILKHTDINILGNHDEAQFNISVADGFSVLAYISSLHTRDLLREDLRELFKSFPLIHSENDLLFVHSSPLNPEMYSYVLNESSAYLNFKSFIQKICFIGHSHLPVIFKLNGNNIITLNDKHIVIENNSRYIINVGSVGQPRDRDPRLSFGFIDTENMIYDNVRVNYNIEVTVRKILGAGLPGFLALRLTEGI
jgi:predicted phosphodiesterase